MQGRIAYRQQFTRCGKQRCRKCKEGEGHGPYWYAYWSENGRTKSKYIGVRLPPELATAQQGGPFSEGEVAQSVPPSAHGTPTPPHGTHKGHYLTSSSQHVVVAPTVTREGTPQHVVAPPVGVRGGTRDDVRVLRIYLLGQFRVERKTGNGWQAIDAQAWQHRRARSLLGCLLSNTEHRLSREQVMKLLWPDLEREIAANRLNGAVHELRHILEPDIERATDFQLLRLERDTLELADSTQIWVDAEAFEQLLRGAGTAAEVGEQERLLEEAAALYKGSYLLEELYSEWAAPRRDALQQLWIDSLLKLATLRAARGSLLEAIAALDRLRASDPTNETALQQLMVYLTLLHRRGEAIRIYRQHAATLKRDYESTPQPETRTLYTTLRQGSVPDEYLAPLEAIRATMAIRSESNEKEREITESASLSAPAAGDSGATFTRPIWQPPYMHDRPFVGRQTELEAMQRMLTAFAFPRATQEREYPHFILLTGDPGMGKTRFIEELGLEAYTQGWMVVWSGAEEGNRLPYALWTPILRLLAQTVEGSSEILEVSRQEQLQFWEAVQARLLTACQSYPLLLLLDDLQWADEDSISFLSYLLNRLEQQPILIVATCQEAELAGNAALSTLLADLQRKQMLMRLPLRPLPAMEVAKLVADLPQERVQSIAALAAGNPFFALALARQGEHQFLASVLGNESHPQGATRPSPPTPGSTAPLEAVEPGAGGRGGKPLAGGFDVSSPTIDGHLARQAGQRPAQAAQMLPEAITSIFERYLSKVSEECLHLLQHAAAFGETFALNQLLSLADEQEQDEDTVLDLLEEALQAKLLREDGAGSRITYSFWHPLLVEYLRAADRPN